MKMKISPSLLSADFSKLAEEIASVENNSGDPLGQADYLHCDVMDGRFVPNITIGPFIIQAIKKSAKKPLDVHIMISEPAKYAEDFCKAGADILTFHIEATDKPQEVIDIIRKNNVKVGVSISPDTPSSAIYEILDKIDLALVMTVHPGFGGQKFIEKCLSKVQDLRKKAGTKLEIEVDGGINFDTIPSAAKAGANVFVAGSFVFKSMDRLSTIRDLRKIATENC